MMVLFLIFAGAGLLISALGVPLWKGRISPNHLYGLRVPATLNDPAVWYKANSRSGFYLIVTGAAIAVVALAVFVFGASETRAVWINTGFLLVSVLIVCVKSVRLASSLARESEDGDTKKSTG